MPAFGLVATGRTALGWAADYRMPTEEQVLAAKARHDLAGGGGFWPAVPSLTLRVSK